MQADNDAQYLLDNGYAEDSPDVQKFREIQAKAHGNAEFLRGLGKSTGVDLTNVGTGMGLADLKDAVNRGIASMMYQQYPQMQEQMKKNALAQAAAASSSRQMAYLIAAAAADPNTKLSDISGLINVTNPDMKFETIDLGGTKVAMTRDAKGRVQGGVQALPVMLSPRDAVGLQFKAFR